MSDRQVGSEQAANAIWRWRDRRESASLSDEQSANRSKAIVQGVVGGLIAGVMYFFWMKWMAFVALGIASSLLLVGLLFPTTLYAAIQRGIDVVAGWVGRFLTLLGLTLIYYLFFLPIGLFARKRGQMNRRWKRREEETFWEDRKSEVNPKQYEHQY